MSRHRQVVWVEREDRIYLMFMFVNAKDNKFNVDPKGIFTLSGSAGADNNCHELKLELFDKVDAEKSIVRINNDTIFFCVLMKAEKKWWNKLLHEDGTLPDEDDEEAPTDGMDEKSRTLVLRVAVLLLRGQAFLDGMNGIYRTLMAWLFALVCCVLSLVCLVLVMALWAVVMAIGAIAWVLFKAIYGLLLSVLVVIWVVELVALALLVVTQSVWVMTMLACVKKMGRGLLVLNVVGRMRF